MTPSSSKPETASSNSLTRLKKSRQSSLSQVQEKMDELRIFGLRLSDSVQQKLTVFANETLTSVQSTLRKQSQQELHSLTTTQKSIQTVMDNAHNQLTQAAQTLNRTSQNLSNLTSKHTQNSHKRTLIIVIAALTIPLLSSLTMNFVQYSSVREVQMSPNPQIKKALIHLIKQNNAQMTQMKSFQALQTLSTFPQTRKNGTIKIEIPRTLLSATKDKKIILTLQTPAPPQT